MHKISEVVAYSVDLPLKNVFETAKGSKTSSPAVIIELRLSNGVSGLGSATPVKYVTGEDVDSALSAVDICKNDLLDANPLAYRHLFETLAEVLPDDPSARAGLEIAVLDAFCKLSNLSMYHFFGGIADEVETDVTIPIVSPDAARELAVQAAAVGFRYLKVKVGTPDTEEDVARVRAISEGAPNCWIRLDANQGFVPTAAVAFATDLQSAGVRLDMLEQPVDRSDLDGLRYVTQRTSVPVFADESVLTPADAFKLLKLEAVDGLNVKLMKSGISGSLDIAAMCQAARKELMLGCMIEPGIGLSTSVHLACGSGSFGRLDLDAHMLLAEQPDPSGFSADGPLLRVDAAKLGHGGVKADARS